MSNFASNRQAGLNQQQICDCFNALFTAAHRVRLRGGGKEPDYLPPSASATGAIIAREDFAASALHEAAHWCVAGKRRRQLPDYGYRYAPPPRGDVGQTRFFACELRNQATELYLAKRAGVAFAASADDPDYCLVALRGFEEQVRALCQRWDDPEQVPTAPPRAVALGHALAAELAGREGLVAPGAMAHQEHLQEGEKEKEKEKHGNSNQ